MANVIYSGPQIGFPTAPVNHRPAPLSFGFGLSTPTGWQASAASPYSPSFNTPCSLSPPQSQVRSAQKRRHDDYDEDEKMDRSPTPEARRPIKRLVQKRLRLSPSGQETPLNSKADKENKEPHANGGNEVDVGMLLATLPSQALLPILNSLLTSHPDLKSAVLSLIPRPTLDMAIHTLDASAKKLREAYPYSNGAMPSHSSTSFGFGSGLASSHGSVAFAGSSATSTGMRDSYIQSRLRPHITDFVSTAFSYLPYFSYLPSTPLPGHQGHKEKAVAHPTETFSYLSSLTSHIVSQPPLTQSSLAPQIFQRLIQEWMAWVDKVDNHVNKDGGMFGMEAVKSWERALDQFADAKITGVGGELKGVRDKWVSKAGWLVGRRETYHMDDDEEL